MRRHSLRRCDPPWRGPYARCSTLALGSTSPSENTAGGRRRTRRAKMRGSEEVARGGRNGRGRRLCGGDSLSSVGALRRVRVGVDDDGRAVRRRSAAARARARPRHLSDNTTPTPPQKVAWPRRIQLRDVRAQSRPMGAAARSAAPRTRNTREREHAGGEDLQDTVCCLSLSTHHAPAHPTLTSRRRPGCRRRTV